MEAGKLRQRIKIQKTNKVQEPTLGQVKPQPQTVAATWAHIEPLTGHELYKAQQVVAEVTHRVTIRYRSGIDASMQVICGSRTFGIGSVLDTDERHIELQLLCVEGA